MYRTDDLVDLLLSGEVQQQRRALVISWTTGNNK